MHILKDTHPTEVDALGNPTFITTFLSNIEDAKACFLSSLRRSGLGKSFLEVDSTSFETLTDYINALNIEADWSEKNPQKGYTSKLSTDLKSWAEVGVMNPKDLAFYLDAESAKEMRKARQ